MSAGATVVDVVVVVDVVAVVLLAFGTLPKINAVALSALAHPTIPIMANEAIDIMATWGDSSITTCNVKKAVEK